MGLEFKVYWFKLHSPPLCPGVQSFMIATKKNPKLYLDKTKVNLLWINPVGFLLLLNLKIGIGAEVIPT